MGSGKILSVFETQKTPSYSGCSMLILFFEFLKPALCSSLHNLNFIMLSFPFIAWLALEHIGRTLSYLVDFLLTCHPPLFDKTFAHGAAQRLTAGAKHRPRQSGNRAFLISLGSRDA